MRPPKAPTPPWASERSVAGQGSRRCGGPDRPEELADAACRLATGGGFGGRDLYSDHDEATFDATRPIVFNAIPDLGAARPDFLDRALIVEFPDMTPEMRRDEAQFWSDFEQVRPRILGALLRCRLCGT